MTGKISWPVIPGRVADANLRCAIAHRGISRFRVRCGACHRAGQRPDPLASPRNDARGEINREPAMTHADTVLVERDGPVTIVSVNRPHCRNAVDGATARKLFDAFLAFDADAEASVAVFTGTGGYFCAGADLKAVAAGG